MARDEDPAGPGESADERREEEEQDHAKAEESPFDDRMVDEPQPLATRDHGRALWAGPRLRKALAAAAAGALAAAKPS